MSCFPRRTGYEDSSRFGHGAGLDLWRRIDHASFRHGQRRQQRQQPEAEMQDEDLYQQGRNLALAGEYDWAIGVLELVSNKKDPRVLNYIGYSHRKAGRFEEAFGYYHKALEIDPNFVLAREYLGEGYVATGRVDLARAQLNEIASRCGTTCEEYQELAEHIETAVN
jgi:tetratricopeptide (TPR) repeat protein